MFLIPLRLALGVGRRFLAERCFDTAASLSFITLLGLVPMVVIGAVVLEPLPFAAKIGMALERFLLDTLLPEKAGAVIAKYLGQFAHRADRVTWLGLGILAVTAILQTLTIEQSFNTIWRTKTPRPWLRRVLIHLTALCAGPLVFAAALAGVTWLAGLSFGLFDASRWVRTAFSQIVPVVFLALLFALLYWAVPNRPVRRWHAVLSGMLAALAFVGMQHLFALYIVRMPTYTAVYGAFAVIPIFLLWLHLSWSIILAGALLTAELPRSLRPSRPPNAHPGPGRRPA